MSEKVRILVAEDDLTTRKMVKSILESLGNFVDEANDADEARQKICEAEFEIVISNWMIPANAEIKPSQKYPFMILLSAKSENHSLCKCLEAGLNDYIVKPFESKELEVRVKQVIRIISLEKRLSEQSLDLEKARGFAEKANKRIKKDLLAAVRIQTSLLPVSLPLFPDVSFEWVCMPLDELAGDGLNVFSLDENHIGFYILDVTGHGVPPALLSVQLNRVLSPVFPNANVLYRNGRILSPGAVLSELSRLFPVDLDNFLSFTMFYGIFNRKTLELKYSTGGHPRPVLHRAGQSPFFLEGFGFPIGSFEEIPYREFTFQLQKNDRLFFYTDGFSEARNEQNLGFGKTLLCKLINSMTYLPLRKILEKLVARHNKWLASKRLGDEMSILAMELK
ncbi:MAG: SpoIIE family protein phosphatase [Candidatus Riflebacteria bacterium]|nr:SpoIIE family protein phosphatase [Candidatus Riflebacteria bacterium]